MSQSLTCQGCGKTCRRTEGFRTHIKTCKILKAHKLSSGHQTQKNDNSPARRNSNELLEPHGVFVDNGELEQQLSADPTEGDALGVFEDLYDFPPSDIQVRDALPPEHRTPGEVEKILASQHDSSLHDDHDSIITSGSINISRGRLSSLGGSNACIRKSFEEDTGRKAGAGLYRNGELPGQSSDSSNAFDTEFDFGFAYWLHRENISSNAITRLLKDQRMEPLRSLISWTSPEELKLRMRRMGTKSSETAGKWSKRDLELKTPRTQSGKIVYTLRYRAVEDAIRFLLGHAGFKDDLVFRPHRLWTTDGPPRRIYSDIASADWWWNTQERIPVEGATVVPLIIASDKTQVTNHQGDLASYPVYLTIGNLPAHIRNSNERPGTILLAKLPIVKDGDGDLRNRVFHESLRVLFDPVMKATDGEGIDIPCADGWTRRCFPIIAAMAIDHEEQIKVTGVNARTHCPLCNVHPDEREDLEVWAPWRTHRDTQNRHEQQRNTVSSKGDQWWVHDVDCFAFGHRYVNIHKTLMVDILHQLLKGVLMHTLGWVQALLEDQMPRKATKRIKAAIESASNRGAKIRTGTVPRGTVQDIIDKRFAIIPTYSSLRIFKHLSAVKQWTGKEQKSILRQVLPVFTPLLEEVGAHDAIRFIRAMVDFILLAMYKSHDDDTLRFMTLALFRMNHYKEVFRPYRVAKQNHDESESEGHFNFPKFHAMVHYTEMIKLLGNAPDLETGHFEHKHVEFIKGPFKLTNKKVGWEDQIMEHYRRKLNMQAQFDQSFAASALTAAEKRERAEQPVKPTAAVDVHEIFGWPRKPTQGWAQGRDIWRTVTEAEEQLGQPMGAHFRQAVAVFVREARNGSTAGMRSESVARRDPDTIEKDDSWAAGLRVQFHASIRCWKKTGQDPDDPDAVEQDMVRCAPNWQGIKGNARYDWVWVQEYDVTTRDRETEKIAFQGRLPARIRLVVSVEDSNRTATPSRFDDTNCHAIKRRPSYTGVFVELYRAKNHNGLADDVHGMTVITPVPASPWRGVLRGRRIYALTSVYHSIHVVPVDENRLDGDMYINNTADFETYNMLWNPTWEEDEAQAACNSRQNRIRIAKRKQKGDPADHTSRKKRKENTNPLPG